MFLTLLRKDWRLAKPAFSLSVLLLTAPLVVGAAFLFFGASIGAKSTGNKWWSLVESIVALFWVGFMFSIVAIPAIAATAWGRERRERTSEFLGALPIPRRLIVGSKLVMTTCLIAVPMVCAAVAWVVLRIGSPSVSQADDILPFELTLTTFAIAIGLAGVAWLLSCFLSSEVFATAITLLLTVVVAVAIYGAFDAIPALRSLPTSVRGTRIIQTVVTSSLIFGLGGFFIGTVAALKKRSN